MAVNTMGISTPAAMPCSTRKLISVPKPVLSAQPTEASVKMVIAQITSLRSDITRISSPVRGMVMISAMR